MYDEIKKKFNALETELSDPSVLADMDKLKEISRKHSDLKDTIGLILEWEKINDNIKQNKEILDKESDKDLKEMALEELPGLQERSEALKKQIDEELHPADPRNKKDILMEIRAGTGGDESALFAADLFRMYVKYAEKMGWKTEVIDMSQAGVGGFKEIIFSVKGKNVYSSLKYEGGTHRVQRVPETEKAGRIHTSAATVAVIPEADEVDVKIGVNDVRVDTFCSSGPGGQSVNTTYSAIRLTHLPTGLVVSCQDQKSQQQNKIKAMQVLRSRLLAKYEDEKRAKDSADRKQQIGTGDRSEKIRTYNFPQDRITDHRIGFTLHSINRIMEGELNELIDALKQEDLKMRMAK